MQNLYERILEKWFYSNNEKVVRLNDIKEIFESAKASVPAETLVRQGASQPVLPCDTDILYCAMAIVNQTNEQTGAGVLLRQETNDKNFDFAVTKIKEMLARQSA